MKIQMMKLTFGVIPVLGLMMLSSFLEIAGQATPDANIRVDTNLVLVNVLVRGKDGQLVRGLNSDQFELIDNGVKRPIETFSAGEAPVSFGVVYDMHPTTDERTKAVIESLRQFSSQLNPQDDIFLIAFNMRGEQTFDFIPTLEQLGTHMGDPAKRRLYSLYDALYFASERLGSSRNLKRVLLVISDCADHKSSHSLSEVQGKLQDIKAEVYAVVFDDVGGFGYSDISHPSAVRRPFVKDATPLDRAAVLDLTLKSGGSTFLGGSEKAIRLLAIYTQVAEEARSHYTLGFYPEKIDEKRHTIRVGLRNVPVSKDFALSYRTSYTNKRQPVRQ